MAVRQWVRLPSAWVQEGRLRQLPWKPGGEGSDNTAALMALTALAHVADSETGVARATYNDISASTGLSRAKLSNGLDVLERLRVLERGAPNPRSTYRLAGYDPQGGWAKFPAKSMYTGDKIAAFDGFQLRKVAELDALKLFFLFVARRNRETNLAIVGYYKI